MRKEKKKKSRKHDKKTKKEYLANKKDKVGKRKSAPAEAVGETSVKIEDGLEKIVPQKKRKRHRSSSAAEKEANKITGVDTVVQTNHGVEFRIEQDDDSFNSVTCSCKKPFAGRLMVECEICCVWYHTDCVNLSKNNVLGPTGIPEHFICDKKDKCKRRLKKAKNKDEELNNNK